MLLKERTFEEVPSATPDESIVCDYQLAVIESHEWVSVANDVNVGLSSQVPYGAIDVGLVPRGGMAEKQVAAAVDQHSHPESLAGSLLQGARRSRFRLDRIPIGT